MGMLTKTQHLQGWAKVPAVPFHFCLNLLEKFSQAGAHFYLRRSQAGQWMIFGFLLLLLLSVKICQIEHYRGQRSTGTWVIEVTEFKFEFRIDL